MKRYLILVFAFLITGISYTVYAQTITKEEIIFLTSEWKGERFPDGRPKISDELIARARKTYSIGVRTGSAGT